MAKATLPTNFKDDVLASAMGGKRRYNMIHNSDGTVSFEDVTNYTQVGSTFGAAQINATNEAVNNAADASKIIDSLETIKANTQSGYIAGALAVKALSSNLGSKSYILSSSSTFSSATGTTLTYDLPSDITDTKNWRVAVLLPFSYSLPYIGVGYNHGSRVMSASFTDNRKVVVTLPLYSTNNKNGVDDEFALVLENLTVALVYVE